MLSAIDTFVRFVVFVFGEKAMLYLITQIKLWYFLYCDAALKEKLDTEYDKKYAEWHSITDETEPEKKQSQEPQNKK